MGRLYEELISYSKDNVYPLHMPGHKRVSNKLFNDDILDEIYKIDITEIDGFDNLHDANGLIKESMANAARLYKSQYTGFLVNGSTVGILSAISAVTKENDTIIIARNCHKSVYNAAYLNRLNVEYLYPEFDEEYDINGPITVTEILDKVKKVKNSGSRIAAVVITSPTYDGVVSDIKNIAIKLHEENIALIVDEAHGAHFGFNEKYPENSVSYADIVIHSVHKTLPAPTQTALIHVNSDIISCDEVLKYLKIYQTSSPSYVLMAGIDRCMDILDAEGYEKLDTLYYYRKYIMSELSELNNIRICPYTEPGKLVISVKGLNITGLELSKILRNKYSIEVEMSQSSYVLAILTMMDTKDGINRLINAIKEIDKDLSVKKVNNTIDIKTYICKENEVKIPYHKAIDMESYTVSLSEANGLVSADYINLYPPGYPIVVPGEVINSKLISLLENHLDNGYNIQGIKEGNIRVIKWES